MEEIYIIFQVVSLTMIGGLAAVSFYIRNQRRYLIENENEPENEVHLENIV